MTETMQSGEGSSASRPVSGRIPQMILPVWKERKRILLFSFAAAIITLLINFFLLPLYYRSTATLLPETEKNKLGSFSQFAGIATLAGLNVPNADVSRLYPFIINSEAVLNNVIGRTYQTKRFQQPLNLIQYFELDEDSPTENLERALRILRDAMTVSYDTRTGVVTISVEMREAQLAADVLNAVIDELDKFMRLKKITNASEQAKWISDRLTQVEAELRAAEDTLKDFREKNRRVMDSPELMLRQERLIRETTVKSTIFVELKKQYELSKIEEIKNITIVNVLDEGRAPARKERPKRATNAVIAFFLVFFGSAGYFALVPIYGGKIKGFVDSMRQMHRQ